MPSPAGEFRTLAKLAAESGRDYFAIRDAARNVRPALVLNGTAYFSDPACRRIVAAAGGAPRAARGKAVAHG